MARLLVVCGGENGERRVSLASGDAVARGLLRCGHDVLKLDTADPDTLHPGDDPLLQGMVGATPPDEQEFARLDREGWKRLVNTLATAPVDGVIPMLHGGWGEDGHIQAVLDLLAIPYLGSGVLASSLCMDKEVSRDTARRLGITVAKGFILDDPAAADAGFDRCEAKIGLPVVVKPNHGGSTVGLVITSQREEFREGVQAILEEGDSALVERYIEGRELTVTIIGDKAYPLIEIRPKTGLYDYTRKYTRGETEYLCPAPVEASIAAKAQELSLQIFRELKCRHFARVDWRLTPEGHLVFLEVNTLPGMTDLSLVPMAAKAEGMDFDALMATFVEMVTG